MNEGVRLLSHRGYTINLLKGDVTKAGLTGLSSKSTVELLSEELIRAAEGWDDEPRTIPKLARRAGWTENRLRTFLRDNSGMTHKLKLVRRRMSGRGAR